MHDVKTYEFELYLKQFGGRHLTKEEWEKLELMLKQMKSYDGEDAD
jgi:hypothetical protein